MDYLLSLLEGNNDQILEFFAAAFDIPVMYGIMVQLIIKLRDDVYDKKYGGKRFMPSHMIKVVHKDLILSRKSRLQRKSKKTGLKIN